MADFMFLVLAFIEEIATGLALIVFLFAMTAGHAQQRVELRDAHGIYQGHTERHSGITSFYSRGWNLPGQDRTRRLTHQSLRRAMVNIKD
jgi:hypothetical protein